MEYLVKIDAFEGPLDLLLYLIKEMKISIDDVNMTDITMQYLDYIHQMEQLDLVIASEFLLMAANLVQLKSKMMLPQNEKTGPDGEAYEENPEKEFKERLKAYKRFKDMVPHLQALYEERSQFLAKVPTDLSKEIKVDPKEILKGNADVYDLLSAFNRVLRRYQLHQPMKTRIEHQTITIEDRIGQLRDYFKNHRETTFKSLYGESPTKEHVVVTFMALLELAKENILRITQVGAFDEIYIHYTGGESHE